MRGIRLQEGRGVDVDAPRPGGDDVLVEPTRLLAADLSRALAGGAAGGGDVGGATFAGRVCVGDGAGTPEGVRVLASTCSPCGSCDLCRAGLSDHCRGAAETPLVAGGVLAGRVATPPAALTPLPEALDDESALLAPLVARSLHAAGRIRIEGKPYVTVLGDGPLALVCAQLMVKLNASVRVLGDEPARFGLCEKWRIKHRHVDEVGRRQDQDVVVIAAGRGEMLDLACGLVRPRGKVVLLGPVEGGCEGAQGAAALARAAADELEVVGVRSGPLDAAVATLVRGELDVVSLIERRSRVGGGQAFAPDARALVEVVEPVFDAGAIRGEAA